MYLELQSSLENNIKVSSLSYNHFILFYWLYINLHEKISYYIKKCIFFNILLSLLKGNNQAVKLRTQQTLITISQLF